MPSAKRRTSDLSVLLKALSDNLREDSAGSQVADHVHFLSRLRAVIPKLLDAFVDPRHGAWHLARRSSMAVRAGSG